MRKNLVMRDISLYEWNISLSEIFERNISLRESDFFIRK